MSNLIGVSRDKLLAELHVGMKDFSVLTKTENIIQLFESDPIILDKHVPSMITSLTSCYFDHTSTEKIAIGRIYYQFSKILGNKRVRIHLPLNVYAMPKVIAMLSSETEWHTQYLLLSWTLMLVMSPFKLGNDLRILDIIKTCEQSVLLMPVVFQIKAELWRKNSNALTLPADLKNIDPIFLNCLLRVLKTASEIPFSTPQLNSLVDWIITIENFKNEIQANYILKALPKLAHLLRRREETWSRIYDILFWLMFSLVLPFTDLRFQLAKSTAKILLIARKHDNESTSYAICDCLEDLITLLESNTSDAIDADRLHTSLLLVAEFARRKLLDSTHISMLCEKVIPVTGKFQQFRMNTLSGHQIRDATNFICWSISREYSDLNAENFETLFLNLLFSANFDSYPLVRKSAMAALQECLGRHGNILLDNVTILRLVEIHIGHLSHAENLYSIFGMKYMKYKKRMIEWLFYYTIGENGDFKHVKNAIKFICELESRINDENFSLLISAAISTMFQKSQLKQDRNLASKVLFLICCRKCSINDEFTKSLNLIQDDPVLRIWNSYVSFKMLSELQAIFYLVQNGSKFTILFVKRTLEIIRHSSKDDMNYVEISSVFNQLIKYLSSNDSTFENSEFEIHFWGEFERLFRLEQPLISSSAPYLHYSKFISLFYDVVTHASCQFKSKIIISLNKTLANYPKNEEIKRFLSDVIILSDDYTVTEQGDIGRLVRVEVVRLILEHLTIFKNFELVESITMKLLRLMGEPSTEISHLSFRVLATLANFEHEEQEMNKNIIKLYNIHYKWRREFWIGYFFSVGAIHSTDKQILSAVDGLINYYVELDSQSRLELSNELIRIIPQSSELNEQSDHNSKNCMGASLREKKVITVTFLNAWYRLLESGYNIPSDFNFRGAFAKFYNLQLLSGSQSIKLQVLRILPLLALSYHRTHDQCASNDFTNQIIKCLLKRMKSGKNGENFSTVQKTAIEALTHLYLRMDMSDKLSRLMEHLQHPEQLKNMGEDIALI